MKLTGNTTKNRNQIKQTQKIKETTYIWSTTIDHVNDNNQ